MFHEIITDKSFANIGAILRAFNDQSVTEYLELCWDILTASNKKDRKAANEELEKLVVVRLCSSNTCKTMSDLVHRHFKDKKMAFTVCTMIGPLFNFCVLEDALKYAECFLYSLIAPKRGSELAKTTSTSRKLLQEGQTSSTEGENVFKEEDEGYAPLSQFDMSLHSYNQHQAIYKNSKCFQHLHEFTKYCKYDTTGDDNKFHSPDFAKSFMKNHLSYLILWGNVMTYQRNKSKSVKRANNGSIENYFLQKKNVFREDSLETGKFGVVRVGRFIRHYSKIIDAKVKEITFDIPDRRLASENAERSQCSSSSRSQRSRSSQDLTEIDVTSTKEHYGKRTSRGTKQTKSSKFFGSERRSFSQP